MPSSIASLINVPPRERGTTWLRHALRTALSLEFFTIPPYLTAMWSIRDPDHPVANEIRWIVREEMSHLGLVCNMLTALGSKPRLNSRGVLPHYPNHLPGGVNPYCVVALERISKCLVARVFMEIERPEFPPVVRKHRTQYATIGAFYSAIKATINRNKPKFAPRHQVVWNQPSHGVVITAIENRDCALEAIDRITTEGEGTKSSPSAGDVPQDPCDVDEFAHFYRFGQIVHEARLGCKVGQWSYTGAPLRFPADHELYMMDRIPPRGYPGVADEFDRCFTRMVDLLELAWTCRLEAQANQALQDAIHMMQSALHKKAVDLMTKPLPGASAQQYYGPTFQYRHHTTRRR